MRRFCLFFVGSAVLFFGVPLQSAQAGIFEFLFPSLKQEEYDPTKDMVAPFAAGQVEEGQEKLDSLPVNEVSLKRPHRLSQEIGAWVMTVVGEAMNFDAGTGEGDVLASAKLFDDVGTQQYMDFLIDKNVVRVLVDGRYDVRSYVNEQPLLLNEGVVNERYRWLFRVPVVVTYLDKNMKSYRGQDARLIQQATLNVQIGRVDASVKPDGLQIEQWSGKIEAFKEKAETAR